MISGEASSPILDRQIRTDPRMVLFVLFKEEAGLLTLRLRCSATSEALILQRTATMPGASGSRWGVTVFGTRWSKQAG